MAPGFGDVLFASTSRESGQIEFHTSKECLLSVYGTGENVQIQRILLLIGQETVASSAFWFHIIRSR